MKSLIWKLMSVLLVFMFVGKVEGICFNETSPSIVSFNNIRLCFSRQMGVICTVVKLQLVKADRRQTKSIVTCGISVKLC